MFTADRLIRKHYEAQSQSPSVTSISEPSQSGDLEGHHVTVEPTKTSQQMYGHVYSLRAQYVTKAANEDNESLKKVYSEFVEKCDRVLLNELREHKDYEELIAQEPKEDEGYILK